MNQPFVVNLYCFLHSEFIVINVRLNGYPPLCDLFSGVPKTLMVTPPGLC